MERRRIGKIHVQRIVELEDPFIPVGQMFPDASAEAIAPHRSWLEPWALCPDNDRLIMPVQSYLLQTSRHTILKAWVMLREDMLLTACIASCRKRFFRLKALYDIAEILHIYHDDICWKTFTEKAKAYRCNNIAYAALLVAQRTVGCKLDTCVLKALAVNPIRATIINFLIKAQSAAPVLSSNSGIEVFGKMIGVSLLLPYVTYRWEQMWHSTVTALLSLFRVRIA